MASGEQRMADRKFLPATVYVEPTSRHLSDSRENMRFVRSSSSRIVAVKFTHIGLVYTQASKRTRTHTRTHTHTHTHTQG